MKDLEISIGNGVFAQVGETFDDRYKALAQQLYQTELQYLDFLQNPSQSTKAINGWVYKQTRGRIGEVVSSISPETILLVVNTLYFKGIWEESFHKMGTRNRAFYPDGPNQPSITVPMMTKGGCMPYYYWKAEEVGVLGVPYKANTTMYIFLPANSTREKVIALQKKMSANVLNDLVTKMTIRSTSLVFPKMHISTSFSLKQVLQVLGLHSVFDEHGADLYRLLEKNSGSRGDVDLFEELQDTKENAINHLRRKTNCTLVVEKEGVMRTNCLKSEAFCEYGGGTCVCCSNMDDDDFRRRRRRRQAAQLTANRTIFVNDMLHKVDLTINEKGTEGGAVTATLIDRISSMVNFIVDKPFLLIVREETTRLPLFYGNVYVPQ